MKFIAQKTVVLFVLSIVQLYAFAQQKTAGQSYYGAYNYTEYVYGSLPIIIGAPHDGTLSPANIPDRSDSTCGVVPVLVRDINVQKIVRSLDTSLSILLGGHPHTIICLVHRKKVEVNRSISEGACSDTTAQRVWNNYMDFMDTARRTVTNKFGRGLFIDFHGHGHPLNRIEIGYLLYGSTLRQNDAYLNRTSIVNVSSVKNLATNNLTAQTHADLIRGPKAFGTLLGNAGYPSVPSLQIPFPDSADAYFDGGYNTARWASRDSGTIDGFQLETYYTGLRDNQHNIRQFTDSLAIIIKNYLDNMFYPGFTLPVSLIDFNGVCQKGEVNLTWQVSQEVNVKSYVVEKSIDGINMKQVAEVNANNSHQYTCNHVKASEGTNYYRLKIIDKDGLAVYSKMIAIYKNSKPTLAIFPNPVNGSFTLNHPTAGKGAFIEILTSTGNVLQKIPVKKGNNKTYITFNYPQSGTFTINYLDGNDMLSGCFVK